MKKQQKHISILVLLFVVILVLSESLIPFVSAESLARPSWLGKEPLVIVGNWDSMPIFRIRVGGNPVWQEDEYVREHTEEAVQKLKEMGVTMAVIHFYKAFGLVAEQEQMEDSKKLTALCKKYGIKVGVYVGSTVGYETFLAEKPEAEKWFVPDYLGDPVCYGGTQTFRKRVYFMHPEYMEYMKRVLKIAIQDLKVDLIHFDNTSMQAQAPIFFHPMAIENFRKYLKDKYTPEMLKKRFGHSETRFVEPPKYARPLSTINDPLFQEWADFRCQQLSDYYGEMEKYIRGLNPEVAVENNPHSGISGDNTIWSQGVDYPRLLSHTDIVWTEEGNKATVGKDGILVSKIRTYKMASTLNNKIFTYTSDSPLQMAEAMAYNRQCMGMVGGALAGYELPQQQRNYIKFYHKNFDHYKDIANVADVAVLHSYATMGFNNDRPYQSTYLFEQTLIQAKIPFDVIFDHNLKDLSKYKVLVLADQECLSDEKLDLVRNFIQSGGGLVATEHTSLYTEWRQRKRDFSLKDLFNVEAPAYSGAEQPEKIVKGAVVKNQIGKGRVVYIPEVKAAMVKSPAERMASRFWKLPLNWQELIESVRWAANENLSINIEAPLTVTMELMQDTKKSKLLLHLLNYDVEKTNLVKNIQVTAQIPAGKSVQQVMLLSPDEEQDQTIPFKISGQSVNFSVPQLKTYSLIVVRLN